MKSYLSQTLFLAGFTRRSQTYAQAMVAADLQPEFSLIYGTQTVGSSPRLDRCTEPLEHRPTRGVGPTDAIVSQGLWLPDLREPLLRTLHKNHWSHKIYPTENVNSDRIKAVILELKPRLIIFSGYGGEIVREGLLGLGIPILHIHPGKLPEFRGSTTLYYSWLLHGKCYATALLLNAGIDTGDIVGEKEYPPPPDGMDPDFIYDPAIRANLLITVLQNYQKNGSFQKKKQPREGTTYFVIHPVLKHLARLQEVEADFRGSIRRYSLQR